MASKESPKSWGEVFWDVTTLALFAGALVVGTELAGHALAGSH